MFGPILCSLLVPEYVEVQSMVLVYSFLGLLFVIATHLFMYFNLIVVRQGILIMISFIVIFSVV